MSMPIRMQHPQHGMKDCYTDQEVANDTANGWARVPDVAPVAAPEPEPVAVVEPDPIVEPEVAGDLRTQYIAKFGKAPHHRMLDETIRAALAED